MSEDDNPKIRILIRAAINSAQRDEGRQIFSVKMFGKADKDLLIRTMKEKGGLAARKADIDAVLGALGEAVVFLGELGLSTELPGFGTFYVTAQGVLDKGNNPVPGKERKLRIRFRPAKSIVSPITTNVLTSVRSYDPVIPVIRTFTDAASGEKNSLATPGGIAGLQGSNLRFNPTKVDEGLWFVSADNPDGPGTKVSQFLKNEPAGLSFQIPSELETGSVYGLRIQTRIKGSKVLRIAHASFSLSVN